MYVAIASGGTAQPVANLNRWGIQFTVDKVDVTSFGDSNKTYVSGLPDASGSFAGFWDSDQVDLYSAAQDGVERKFYLYPDRSNDPSDYYFGTGLFDFSVEGAVDGAVTVSGNWAAAGAISRVST